MDPDGHRSCHATADTCTFQEGFSGGRDIPRASSWHSRGISMPTYPAIHNSYRWCLLYSCLLPRISPYSCSAYSKTSSKAAMAVSSFAFSALAWPIIHHVLCATQLGTVTTDDDRTLYANDVATRCGDSLRAPSSSVSVACQFTRDVVRPLAPAIMSKLTLLLQEGRRWPTVSETASLFKSWGPFIATQLNSTQLDVELNWVELRLRSVYSDATQLNSTSSLVELCRYKLAFSRLFLALLFCLYFCVSNHSWVLRVTTIHAYDNA